MAASALAPKLARPTNEIEITLEMIEAGERVFFDRMIEGGYLARALPSAASAALMSSICLSMMAMRPLERKN